MADEAVVNEVRMMTHTHTLTHTHSFSLCVCVCYFNLVSLITVLILCISLEITYWIRNAPSPTSCLQKWAFPKIKPVNWDGFKQSHKSTKPDRLCQTSDSLRILPELQTSNQTWQMNKVLTNTITLSFFLRRNIMQYLHMKGYNR